MKLRHRITNQRFKKTQHLSMNIKLKAEYKKCMRSKTQVNAIHIVYIHVIVHIVY